MRPPVFLLFALLSVISSRAADPSWQPLWDGRVPGPGVQESADTVQDGGRLTRIARPEIQVWEPDGALAGPRPALLIFPGGGYTILAMDHEGRQIAQWAVAQGMVAVVVKYRVSDRDADNYGAPWPLTDARRAVATVRHKAATWRVDPAKIGVIGFSAGGHLAAMTSFASTTPTPATDDAIGMTSARPDFSLLVYPVISMDQSHGHSGSKRRLLGSAPDDAAVAAHCPAGLLDKSAPPVFLAHAADDPVSCLNSLDLARAARQAGVPVELHLYESGGHGFGMRKQGKPADDWPRAAAAWLRHRGILGK